MGRSEGEEVDRAWKVSQKPARCRLAGWVSAREDGCPHPGWDDGAGDEGRQEGQHCTPPRATCPAWSSPGDPVRLFLLAWPFPDLAGLGCTLFSKLSWRN